MCDRGEKALFKMDEDGELRSALEANPCRANGGIKISGFGQITPIGHIGSPRLGKDFLAGMLKLSHHINESWSIQAKFFLVDPGDPKHVGL